MSSGCQLDSQMWVKSSNSWQWVLVMCSIIKCCLGKVYTVQMTWDRTNVIKPIEKCVLVFNNAEISRQAVVLFFFVRTISATAWEAFWGRPEKRLFKLNRLEIKGWIGFSESCLDLNAWILAVFKIIVEFFFFLLAVAIRICTWAYTARFLTWFSKIESQEEFYRK